MPPFYSVALLSTRSITNVNAMYWWDCGARVGYMHTVAAQRGLIKYRRREGLGIKSVDDFIDITVAQCRSILDRFQWFTMR